MKVLKFGGSSVGTPESLARVKGIVDSNENTPVIVVVSALGGVTDKLIAISNTASRGCKSYEHDFVEMRMRHDAMVETLFVDNSICKSVRNDVAMLMEELENIFKGIYLIKDLSSRTLDTILSYGERLSSLIVSQYIPNSTWIDSREIIKTETKLGKHVPDMDLTTINIKRTFQTLPDVTVMGGFISSDRDSGETTNLGRGGSDYTAALLASSLGATCLEIWTDVDGFMTADPRVIDKAYTIDELSYDEATELCNFGAKVIYPPTIYPVCHTNIPIRVKNTFNPNGDGTVITAFPQKQSKKVIKGISSIDNTSLITVHGLGMVGVIGVNYRIFKSLAKRGISVFLVSQASSENSTSIGVRGEDSVAACEALDLEFAKEIDLGLISKMRAHEGLATIAVVGNNMRGNPGVAGKLFQALGRSGINIIACAQGASEMNISVVVEGSLLKKGLNVLHDSFFLSEFKELNIFVCGIGTVGASLLSQIERQQQKLMSEQHLKLNVVGIANGSKLLINREGIALENYKSKLLETGIPSSPLILKDEIIRLNMYNSVFVDCTASKDVAALYYDFLNQNISIVAANKIAASSAYSNYSKLKKEALEKDTKFLFETNVGAGLPIINTINDLINSGDKIIKIEAVLSGTLNYIFNKISKEVPLSKTIGLAQKEGYSEPDPRIDLSGTDVIRKLVILAREAGYPLEQEQVEKHLFIPTDLFNGSLDDFWKNIQGLDAEFEEKRLALEKENKRWRFVASYDQGVASVRLEAVSQDHPFYRLEGSNNAILLTTDRYREYPMMIQGYGAGADVTAAGVFADVMSIANI